ncbi:uncharacterized protein NEMAJ01_1686 [Nematocida major]|uniref:uncharacterized protein n=1 Tax=Nematocida major TaxID=1912982 RepID=UPI002007B65A|nr:uncharacterized protein NEMAJ01_1686 [Nematocida major]KAH9386790.1 hypothetical protein NEMAJ01_1686 [Nematocida major]
MAEDGGKAAFLERIGRAVKQAQIEKDMPLEASVHDEIFAQIQSPLYRGNSTTVDLLGVLASSKTKIQWILESKIDLLESVVIILKKVSFVSHVLLFRVKEVCTAILKKRKESTCQEEIASLLLWIMRIANEIPNEEYFREAEKSAISELRQILGVQWEYTGVLGRTVKEQSLTHPVLVLSITSHTPEDLAESPLQEIESRIDSSDRYYIFPQAREVKYCLTCSQKDLLYLCAKHLLLLGTQTARGEAGAIARALLLEGYTGDALLVYAESLEGRNVAVLSLIESAITPNIPMKEKEHELLWARALTATASHVQAIPIFEKYHETEGLIAALLLAGKRDVARPLLQNRLAKLMDELAVQEIACGTYFAGTQKKCSSSIPLLKIELASLSYAYGVMDQSIEHLNIAFGLVKTAKHANALCKQLLVAGRAEEALAILDECKFEVQDVEILLTTAVSLAQTGKCKEAEKLLNYGRVFNPKNERIDMALHNVLLKQGKYEKGLDILLEKASTYSRNIPGDCHLLFSLAMELILYKYASDAIKCLYKKTGKMPAQWVDDLYAATEKWEDAKEAFLSAVIHVKTLVFVERILKILENSSGLLNTTEYYARKRVIEYCIHKREYEMAHEHLKIMKSLSCKIDQDQDFVDVVCAFYKSQQCG